MKERMAAVIYTFLLLFALFTLSVSQQRNPGAGDAGFSPALLPSACAGIIALASLILLIKSWRKRAAVPSASAGWRRAAAVQAAIISYGILYAFFGFTVAGIALLLQLQLIMGQRRWMVLLCLSLPPPLLLWLIGTRLLGVALP